MTSRHVRPQSVSSHRAASAMRRSPGGTTPKSRRKRPEEPPSSATVTTAVRSAVRSRSADSDAASPCPPPKATTDGPFGAPPDVPEPGGMSGSWPVNTGRSLPPKVAVRRRDCHARLLGKALRKLLRDRDRAMLAARAAHGDRRIVLVLLAVASQHGLERVHKARHE